MSTIPPQRRYKEATPAIIEIALQEWKSCVLTTRRWGRYDCSIFIHAPCRTRTDVFRGTVGSINPYTNGACFPTESDGFEPSREFFISNVLAGRRIKPLCHDSLCFIVRPRFERGTTASQMQHSTRLNYRTLYFHTRQSWPDYLTRFWRNQMVWKNILFKRY